MQNLEQEPQSAAMFPAEGADGAAKAPWREDFSDIYWASFRAFCRSCLKTWPDSRAFEPGRATGFRIIGRNFAAAGDARFLAALLSSPVKGTHTLCDLDTLAEPLTGRFDFISCIEMLGQMSESETLAHIRNICAAAPRILFSAAPENSEGAASGSGRAPLWWLWKFAEYGFAPAACFDASFLRPWAIALEKSPRALDDAYLRVHADLIEMRIAAWRSEMAFDKELARTRSNLQEAVESLTTRHAALMSKPPRLNWLQRLSRFRRRLHFARQSIFFDPDWYVRTYGDVPDQIDPATHYLTKGVKEGRDPGPVFSARGYMAANLDVVDTGYDALVHFERYGKFEGRPMALRFPGAGRLVFDKIGPASAKAPPQPDSASAPAEIDYQDWIERCDTITDSDRAAIRLHIASLPSHPLISVVMPVYETPAALLREAIDSVREQIYPNWELCIADDASPSPHVAEILNDYATCDSRIRILRRDINGHISAATNSALSLARGEHVALMDHDDILAENALYEVAVVLNQHPDADMIYSDEDRIDDNGLRHAPYFKTDWNPELFLGHNMISHLGVYRRSLVEKVGGLRQGLEGSQDYDLALRVSRETTRERIVHIPAVLYHWRSSREQASFSESQLHLCVESARRAKIDYLRALGDESTIEPHPVLPHWDRVRRPIPNPAPLVSVIVPTRNRADLLRPCLDGLLRRTDYPAIEIIIIDHESDDAETLALLKEAAQDSRVRVMPYRGLFNFSDMNNKAVALARGEMVCLLNNDVDVIASEWLAEMVALASRPENGVIGAKLLYPDGKMQHGGVALGAGGVAGHFHLGASGDEAGYFGRLQMTSNVSAVTGACLVVRKAIYQEVGGLNAADLAVAFNDVDFCLKVAAAGYFNVWTPYALLHHHESPSRGLDIDPKKAARFRREVLYMKKTWGEALERDPFYNLNFSLSLSTFQLALPTRRVKPWTEAASAG